MIVHVSAVIKTLNKITKVKWSNKMRIMPLISVKIKQVLV